MGFTEYEAKVYLALLASHPLTGYAVARRSGVPRSKVYEVLDGLIARGAVLVSHGEPATYGPLPPSDLVALTRQRSEAALVAVGAALGRFAAERSDDGVIWDISGRDTILARVREVVGRAERRVLLQLWAEDAADIREALVSAGERGVRVVVVAYGDPGLPLASVHLHEPGPEEITREYGGRWVIVSADDAEIVAGAVWPESRSRAAWSRHPALVMPITEQIKHDLYLAEILRTHRGPLEATFGPSLVDLRAAFGLESDELADIGPATARTLLDG